MIEHKPYRSCGEQNGATTGSATGYCVHCLEDERYGDSNRLVEIRAAWQVLARRQLRLEGGEA